MTPPDRAGLAILISGRGSNMQAFLDARSNGTLDADIRIVISNNPDVEGLQRATAAGITARGIDHRAYDSREAFDQALVEELQAHQVDLVILAGFMRILTPLFLQPFAGRLLNIHPSLLPKYPGLHTHQRALDAGDKEAGATVHFVTPELDGGPPIIHARVAVLAGDTADTLAARVVAQEHVIYPIAAQWYVQGRLRLTEKGAYLDDNPIPSGGIQHAPGPH